MTIIVNALHGVVTPRVRVAGESLLTAFHVSRNIGGCHGARGGGLEPTTVGLGRRASCESLLLFDVR